MITTKDCAVHCSLLPAPSLSLFSNPLVADGDWDTLTEESETAEETTTRKPTTSVIIWIGIMFRISLLCMNSSNVAISFCSGSKSHLPLHLNKKYIVFEECLLSLFQKCHSCGAESTNTSNWNISSHQSALLKLYKWDSQPCIKNISAGNILLSSVILFSGASPAKIFRLLKTYGCACINSRTYFKHQKKYLQPSIFSVWNQHQNGLFQQLR